MSANSLTKSELIRSEYVIPSLLNNKDYVRSLSEARYPKEEVRPGTAKWVARRLDDNSPEMAIGVLRSWTHPNRVREASAENVERIKRMVDEAALEALLELAKPRRYVRGIKGQQLDLELTLGTLNDQRSFRVEALLDSGCTGSCIDRKFIAANKIQTRKLPIPVLVYNADGSENAAGTISEAVRLHVRIKGHTEVLDFAVTELGKSDVFIGHDWLKIHNPSIDWGIP